MTSSPFAAVHNGGSHSAHLSRASSDAQLASMQDAPDFTALLRFLASPARCMHLSRLSPPPCALMRHPLSLHVAQEHGCRPTQAANAGHSWA